MPAHTTIITPIKTCTKSCRQYLRDNAEPSATSAGPRCSLKFRFDEIPTLHFCSFIVLDGDDEFGPSLVFEATFDGSREDFLSDLLRNAPGMHELYSHCVGYPDSGPTIPQIVREYLIRHDAGAHIYFSGSPGRTAAQIKDEHEIYEGIVSHFDRLRVHGIMPPRLSGLFETLRSFIRTRTTDRWAEQSPSLPWEIRFRTAIAGAAVVATLVLACVFGTALATLLGWSPRRFFDLVAAFLEKVNQFGAGIAAYLATGIPWSANLVEFLQPAIPLVGLGVIWVCLRLLELVLGSWSKHPRDQFFISRFPLHIVVILRYTALLFLAGAVALALIPERQGPRTPVDFSVLLTSGGFLLGIALALLVLQHWATTLEISVELNKLDARREKWRRLCLDLIKFAMAVAIAAGILVIARYLPVALDRNLAGIARLLVFASLVMVAYGLIGVLAGYGIGFLLLLLVRRLELRDKRKFADPAVLEARARINATKYAREEGGNNRLQNHLASITRVKPGLLRFWMLRVTLFVINLLSRFWFNRGELGGIPTILSARWVLIDGGRRLLFLDNYGGAWESYLNEFIDMTAVKGLNAIWSNTFVKAKGKCYSFPETRFFFWQGAQAERPFKAYVRESQIETIAWYSAYQTLSVININTSSELRQSLCKQLISPEIDAVFQNL
jgi:hypothetical protein